MVPTSSVAPKPPVAAMGRGRGGRKGHRSDLPAVERGRQLRHRSCPKWVNSPGQKGRNSTWLGSQEGGNLADGEAPPPAHSTSPRLTAQAWVPPSPFAPLAEKQTPPLHTPLRSRRDAQPAPLAGATPDPTSLYSGEKGVPPPSRAMPPPLPLRLRSLHVPPLASVRLMIMKHNRARAEGVTCEYKGRVTQIQLAGKESLKVSDSSLR